MLYTEVSIFPSPFTEETADVIAALIAPLGFDSFSTEGETLLAYCPSATFLAPALDAALRSLPLPGVEVKWQAREVATENWNAEWEESVKFEPIIISDLCCIHGPASTSLPPCRHDIVIAPKMSFGSGHHETTRMLLEEILALDDEIKKDDAGKEDAGKTPRTALDMGTGTGILAILCAKLGYRVRAIEIDDWVAENAVDNVLLNNLAGQITVQCGDASLLSPAAQPSAAQQSPGIPQSFDLILANINRNVLLADMPAYAAVLNPGGRLIMSGFYADDLAMIRKKAAAQGLSFVSSRTNNNWTAASFKR